MKRFYNPFLISVLFLYAFIFTSLSGEYVPITFASNFSHRTFDKEFKEKSSADYSCNNQTYDYGDSLSVHNSHFNTYTLHDFKDHFTTREYTESQILNQRCLYMLDEFVKFAQTYPNYKSTVEEMHAALRQLSRLQKAYCIAKGTYCKGLQKRIKFLYNRLHEYNKTEQKNHSFQDNGTSSVLLGTHDYTEPIIKDNIFSMCHAHLSEYGLLHDVYRTYVPSLSRAIAKRSNAFSTMMSDDRSLQNVSKSYGIKSNIRQLLGRYGYDNGQFTQCFGNQLQQVIHQESLDILNRIDGLLHDSLLYDHQEALVDFTAAMVDYNHAGMADKAMAIGDLCWTLLDYGQAIAEGAALGIYSAARDILTNPIEATVSIVAGKQVLAFQLCKVLYNVAEIGVTAIHDSKRAQEEWNKYTEPLNNLIDAINKKEITVRGAIKGGTAFVVGYKAQGKLLGGLGKLCNTIKHKSINFVRNNSLLNPQEYLTTPEGLLFKATGQSGRLEQSIASSLKKSIEKKVAKHKSIKGLIKKEGLPTKGKLRYVPPKKFHIADGLPEKRLADGGTGFIDRFGNVWVQGVSRTKGQPHEWDVQLSKQGIQQVGWMTRDNSHLNVSLDGRVTHK